MDDRPLHRPPLRLWKFPLLMLATLSLYQFVWLYRTVVDLRAHRDAAMTPWHWAVAPLLGPLFAIPAANLAHQLQLWRDDAGVEQGHLAEPVLVGMFVAIAYLPCFMLVFGLSTIATFGLISAALLCLPFLFLQHQLNLIKADEPDDNCLAPAWRLRRWEVVATIAGACLVVPLYLYGFSYFWETRGASDLALGTEIESEEHSFRLTVGDEDWTRLEPGGLVEDAEFEFLGPDQWTWAVIYENDGFSVDEIMSYRVSSIRGDYRKARCQQRKSLVGEELIVRGDVECTGFSAADGRYVFIAQAQAYEDDAVEIIGFSAHRDEARFAAMSDRLRRFVEGIEVTVP